uniref:Serine/arginine-rich splicing factor 4-like n=1 Tax=Sinocyclocheilus grahami TaxID=75366 RepID=A0A672Q5H1_SINGR
MSRVYVGKLSYRAREKDVERFFKGYGKILEVDLKNGYGFVEFDDPRDADDAVCDLNGKDLCGKRVIVEHTIGQRRDGGTGSRSGRRGGGGGGGGAGGDRYGPPTRTDYRLIVENLSSRCSWQDLKDYMRQAGEVTYADTNKGRKNEGVIEFRQYSDMKRALEKLDGTEVNGRKIRLIEDRPGARRRRSYSRSASRSSGSRSRSRSTSKKTKGRSSRMEESSNGARRGGESARDNSTSCSPPSKKGKRENKRDRSYSRSRSRSRSKSGNDRDLSRESGSRSQEATKSGDEGRVAERAHCSRAHSRSRSQTPPDADLRRESRSKSKSRSHSRSRSYSRSRSRSRSRS